MKSVVDKNKKLWPSATRVLHVRLCDLLDVVPNGWNVVRKDQHSPREGLGSAAFFKIIMQDRGGGGIHGIYDQLRVKFSDFQFVRSNNPEAHFRLF